MPTAVRTAPRQPRRRRATAPAVGLPEALSFAAAAEVCTGTSGRTPEEWALERQRRAKRHAQTAYLADVLESQGIKARRDDAEPIQAISLVTGEARDLTPWRPIRLLPDIAEIERAAMLNECTFHLENHDQKQYTRLVVATNGKRMPLFHPDARDELQAMSRRISTLAFHLKRDYEIDVILRSEEFTVDENLSLHWHHNILLRPTKCIPREIWTNGVLADLRHHLGRQWVHDSGRLKDTKEAVKYVAKPGDIELLCNVAAWAIDEWSPPSHPRPTDAQIRARIGGVIAAGLAKRGQTIGRDEMQARIAAAMQHARQLMIDHHAMGSDHPLVWLHHLMYRRHIVQPMGGFRQFRKEVKAAKQKVVWVKTESGTSALRLVQRSTKAEAVGEQKPRRDGRKPITAPEVADMVQVRARGGKAPEEALAEVLTEIRETHSYQPQTLRAELRRRFGPVKFPRRETPENNVLALMSPVAASTPWAEPAVLVQRFTFAPKTFGGVDRLERMAEWGVKAGKWWDAAGAPDYQSAVAVAREAMAAAEAQAVVQLRPEAPLYSTHPLVNCFADEPAKAKPEPKPILRLADFAPPPSPEIVVIADDIRPDGIWLKPWKWRHYSPRRRSLYKYKSTEIAALAARAKSFLRNIRRPLISRPSDGWDQSYADEIEYRLALVGVAVEIVRNNRLIHKSY